jgi:ribonuclease E
MPAISLLVALKIVAVIGHKVRENINMAKKMLIDATHAEETRVAVVDGNRLVEFDYESKLRKQLKGGIFLAKVTRVEPSLQAAFVNFGGNRHAFLPFSEIHPDYFRIPVADREALMAAQQAEIEAAMAAEEAQIAAEEAALAAEEAAKNNPVEDVQAEEISEELDNTSHEESDEEDSSEDGRESDESSETDEENSEDESSSEQSEDETEEALNEAENEQEQKPVHKFVYRAVTEINPETFEIVTTMQNAVHGEALGFDPDIAYKVEDWAKAQENVVRARLHWKHSDDGSKKRSVWVAYHEDNTEIDHEMALAAEQEEREKRRNYRGRGRFRGRNNSGGNRGRNGHGGGHSGGHNRGRHPMQNRQVEILGGEGVDSDQPFRPSLHLNYKIQEVIKRGQIMLIQVQKEERGNKGAAVTTYLSLPGRYCVLMPNSPRGGGVSRKIASFAERKRMRDILRELGTPEGMSVILRTAGVQRESEEIKRDLDYLVRLWNNIRELTLQSVAPAGIYEESNLVKRAVRDIYAGDIEEIQVAGENGFKQAKEFMKLLMPSSVKKVHQYKDDKYPLFHRYQVENQIAAMGEPTVEMRSGGYLVINPTEALVSIDVNSGRATKERHIEETALKTNLEAADEVARQLRLRDLGGLVVIDFIDMEDHRNNAKVERRIRDALSTDRARIQVGRISSFGLLELSRQRLNPSLTEAQFQKCPHCKGVGHIRTIDSAAILALRSLEEEGIRSRAGQVFLSVPNEIALYILNQKREMLADIERRYGFTVFIRVDEELAPTGYKLESLKASATDDEDGDVVEQDSETMVSVDEAIAAEESTTTSEDTEGQQQPRGRSRNNRGRNDKNNRGDRNRDGRGRGRKSEDGNENQPDNKQVDVSTPSPSALSEKIEAPKEEPKFRAKRFRARTDTPAQDQNSAPPSQEAKVSVASPSNTNTESGNDGDSKKRGWWNRLIEK